MASVAIKINGREYRVACDDGQEDHLRLLADDVDERVQLLSFQMGGNLSETMGLLMAALMLSDELIENKKETESLLGEYKRLKAQFEQEKMRGNGDARLAQVENAMAETLEEIALRIEKIADKIEIA